MPRKQFPRPAFILAFVQSAFMLFLAIDLLLHDSIREIFKEGHVIEEMSALYLLAASGLLFLLLHEDKNMRQHWHLPVILLLMALREFDMDKRLTSEGLLQLRLYTSSSPWPEKLAGILLVLLILICAWRLATHTMPLFWRGLHDNIAVSLLSLGAAIAIISAKTVDGLDRKLAPYGVNFDPGFINTVGKFEEILELIASIMLVMAVTYYGRRATQTSILHRPPETIIH